MTQIINIIKDLTKYPERQGQYLLDVQNYICKILKENDISFNLNTFQIETPTTKASLRVDGEDITCKGCSFVGGEIKSKSCILTSTTPSRFNIENSNINYNPFSDDISCSNFYFAPAIAVSRNNLDKIIKGKEIKGNVEVAIIKTEVAHILVGNLENPDNIVFTHFDSISVGAMDNASGVAVAIKTIIENKNIIQKNLFVFDPCEELSFDKPTYWGHGFRVFEKKYYHLLEQAKKIIPLDCVGNGNVTVSSDPFILNLAFPVKNFESLKSKMVTLYSDIDKLMTFYHSSADVAENLSEEYLVEAKEKLVNLLTY